jgi:hypothetical protein
MTPAQSKACANRIRNVEDRAKFVEWMAEADRLHFRASELRNLAWDLYRRRDESVFA